MKTFKRISALLLALILALGMTACGPKEIKGLEGTWHTVLPVTDAVNKGITGMGVDISEIEGFDELEISFSIDLELRDGEYTLSLNEKDTQKSLDAYIASVKKILTEYLYQTGADQGLSREEMDAALIESAGMGAEEYVSSIMDQAAGAIDLGSLVKDGTGFYAADEDRIYFGGSQKTLKEKEIYVEYTLKHRELSLDKAHGNALDLDSLKTMDVELPLVFTK